jgi:hypothetical protein
MESKLAKDSKQRLIEAMRRLTPEQRLAAYVTHCELMMALRIAGAEANTARRLARK